MKLIELYPQECLKFAYDNPFREELGRLTEYQGSISIPRKYYVVALKSNLVVRQYHIGISCRKQVIRESLPRTQSIGLLDKLKLAIRTLYPQTHKVYEPTISLVHRQATNYGHWLMDYLPRAIAVLHYRQLIGGKIKVIVPSTLALWQQRSLELIGLDSDNLIPVSCDSKNPLNIQLDTGIFTRSHSFYSDSRFGCKDALSPLVFRSIKQKILSGISYERPNRGTRRLLVLRKTSGDTDRRFILNETDLKNLLEPHGFLSLYLEDLTFDQQVCIFSGVSHVISVHGSGLTNLLFSEGAHVLEMFSSGHGIRPEYWQLTAMTGGRYAHFVVETQPPFHDMLIPLDKVKQFLDLTL